MRPLSFEEEEPEAVDLVLFGLHTLHDPIYELSRIGHVICIF
jgi:hypothetical protein